MDQMLRPELRTAQTQPPLPLLTVHRTSQLDQLLPQQCWDKFTASETELNLQSCSALALNSSLKSSSLPNRLRNCSKTSQFCYMFHVWDPDTIKSCLMGLCWEEPSPDLCNTFAGRPWPVTLAGDRGQPRASSRAGEPGTGSSRTGAQAGAHSP